MAATVFLLTMVMVHTPLPNENFNGDVNFSFDVSDGTDTVSANIDVSQQLSMIRQYQAT